RILAASEPAHAGFVGIGMLTAAVCGEVFASPPAAAVTSAIHNVASAAGTLLIVKNYTGDRLAFGVAAEQARARGARVETVYVADDVAVDGGPVTGRRGLAGTLFVHKLAGALAERGLPLALVASAARAVAASVHSVGASLSVCFVPGVPPSTRLDGDKMEIGLGIHGEPGALLLPHCLSSDELAARLLQALVPALMVHTLVDDGAPAAAAGARRVALLVNNLGGMSNLEMGIFAASTLRACRAALPDGSRVCIERFFIASAMTSLNARGVSITFLNLDAVDAQFQQLGTGVSALEALDAPAPHTSWPTSVPLSSKEGAATTTAEAAAGVTGAALDGAALRGVHTEPTPTLLDGSLPLVARCMLAAAEAVAAEEHTLNALDAKCGDGDCGTTMALIVAAVRTAVHAQAPPPTCGTPTAAVLAQYLHAVAESVASFVGGSSGGLYALLLQAAANSVSAVPPTDALTPRLLADALRAGFLAIQACANSRPGQRTMLDALIPAFEQLDKAGADASAADVASAVAHATNVAAHETASMAPRAGRASYVSEEAWRGVPDPGAMAVAAWMRGIASCLK
ncbi:MAG: DAK2 domain-containing protein, partial [Methanobacteriota archaeon]